MQSLTAIHPQLAIHPRLMKSHFCRCASQLEGSVAIIWTVPHHSMTLLELFPWLGRQTSVGQPPPFLLWPGQCTARSCVSDSSGQHHEGKGSCPSCASEPRFGHFGLLPPQRGAYRNGLAIPPLHVSPMYTRLNRPPHACGHQDRSINNLWCNDCSNKLSDIEERCTAAVDVDTLVSLTETMTEYEPTPDQTSGAIEHMRHSGAALSLLADVDAFFSRAKMAQVSVAQPPPPPLNYTHAFPRCVYRPSYGAP